MLETGGLRMSEIKFPSSEEINAQQLNNQPGREYNKIHLNI